MHRISVRSELTYQVNQPTHFLLNIAAAKTDHQKVVSESLEIEPDVALSSDKIGFPENRIHRLFVENGLLKIRYTARAELTPVVDRSPQIEQLDYASLPADVLPYLNPSRYCESDRLGNFAFAQFGSLPANFDRVNAICDWVHDSLTYTPGSTNSLTTACDVLLQRAGVCRDYAHLAITFCRALGLPARYVSGYAARLEPPDFHGFFEAYLGNYWYLFDATRLAPPAGFVRIGVGRDAADTAFCTILGSAQMQNMEVFAEEESDADLLNAEVTETAVSTA